MKRSRTDYWANDGTGEELSSSGARKLPLHSTGSTKNTGSPSSQAYRVLHGYRMKHRLKLISFQNIQMKDKVENALIKNIQMKDKVENALIVCS
jgi:hypothetical protein